MSKTLDRDPLDALFGSSEPDEQHTGSGVTELKIDQLVPFSQHPFRLYEGERMQDMVQSIRDNGVMVPVLVRKLAVNQYEILAGHNRTNAAQLAGLKTIPAILREGLTDDEALILVTESNTHQRSLSDMRPSELAAALKMQMEAYKRLRRRSGYQQQVESQMEAICQENAVGDEARHVGISGAISQKWGFGKDQIHYYIRLNELCSELLERTDNKELALRVAVYLSFLKLEEQQQLNQLLSLGAKIDMPKAEKLRELSRAGRLSLDAMQHVLSGKYKEKKKALAIKLSPKFIGKYFNEAQGSQEITTFVETAVAFYSDYLKRVSEQKPNIE